MCACVCVCVRVRVLNVRPCVHVQAGVELPQLQHAIADITTVRSTLLLLPPELLLRVPAIIRFLQAVSGKSKSIRLNIADTERIDASIAASGQSTHSKRSR